RDRNLTGVQTCALPIFFADGGESGGHHERRAHRDLARGNEIPEHADERADDEADEIIERGAPADPFRDDFDDDARIAFILTFLEAERRRILLVYLAHPKIR